MAAIIMAALSVAIVTAGAVTALPPARLQFQ